MNKNLYIESFGEHINRESRSVVVALYSVASVAVWIGAARRIDKPKVAVSRALRFTM